MTLAEAVGVIRRLWIIPAIAILLGVLAGAGIGLSHETSYRSDVNLVLTADIAGGDSKDVSNALIALDRRTLVGTLAVVAGSDVIESTAIDAAGVPASDITGFSGTAVADANVVTLEVTGTSAASVEAVTSQAVDAIVTRFGRQYPLYHVESIDRPKPVVDTGAPWWQLLTAGLVGGALLGVLVALSVDAAQRSRLDRDPSVPMGYVAVPVEFVKAMESMSVDGAAEDEPAKNQASTRNRAKQRAASRAKQSTASNGRAAVDVRTGS